MQDRIKEEILNYEKLSHGWDMGEGIPPDEIVIKRALKIYDFGKNLQFNVEPRPLSGGGIMLTFYRDEYFLDVSIFPSNTELHYEIGKGYKYTSKEIKYLNDQTIIDTLLNSKLWPNTKQ